MTSMEQDEPEKRHKPIPISESSRNNQVALLARANAKETLSIVMATVLNQNIIFTSIIELIIIIRT